MDGVDAYVRDHAVSRIGYPRNFYGRPIIPADLYDEPHVVNPMSAGNPPCCSCGWTPHGDFGMADHLADMGEFVNGIAVMREP